MEIIIPLPNCESANNYKELRSYLSQLELAVHHAQKAVEQAEKDEIPLTEEGFICFEHPFFRRIEKIEETPGNDFQMNYYDELQNIELRIYIA